MQVLAIDIGGTKFQLAAFDSDRMARLETRATDKARGFGNLVAGITIMKKGTGTASPEEVREKCKPWQSI
ncbi:MAG TPA: hypothetical protein VMB03_11395 [Bryobacteraceae bacterium]|nr:hypothetical protein [Bryobacteraceae bacterium]